MLFMAFTLGAIVAAVGGLAFLWAPGVPAVMLSVYIAYLRSQERRRFTYVMDRRRAEVAAQRLRERQPRRRPPTDPGAADEPEDGPEADTDPGLSALAADRRALVEQTDHAEWVDQQRERRSGPSGGDSWDPVPVPLPTYVTAPVAPRATSDVDLGGPDAWSSARSSTVEPNADRSDGRGGRGGGGVRRVLRGRRGRHGRLVRRVGQRRGRPARGLGPARPRTRPHAPLRPVRGRRPAARGQRVTMPQKSRRGPAPDQRVRARERISKHPDRDARVSLVARACGAVW
jgi:hypothetical protein